MFSILIPSFNNLEYLKLCIKSIKKNSEFDHQIIVHINDGKDGSLDFIKYNNIEYTFSHENIGMPKALNLSSKLAKFTYILISHDDFYYCPGWDTELIKEIEKIGHKNFYISGTMVGAGQISFDAGQSITNFNEEHLLKNLKKSKHSIFRENKCPGLVHKIFGIKLGVGAKFSPTGDDTDFAMKLWNSDIRIFKD